MGSCGYHMCRLGGVAAHTTGMSPPAERVFFTQAIIKHSHYM